MCNTGKVHYTSHVASSYGVGGTGFAEGVGREARPQRWRSSQLTANQQVITESLLSANCLW